MPRNPATDEVSQEDCARVSQAWRTWVDCRRVKWEAFVTLTFNDHVTALQAARAAEQWVRSISRRRFPSDDRLIRAVWSVELHQSGAPHVHAVLADLAGTPLNVLKSMWGRRGFAAISLVEDALASARYVLKHVGADNVPGFTPEVFV